MANQNMDRVFWCDRGWMPFYYGFCPSEKAWKREMKKFNLDLPYPTFDACITTLDNDKGEMCIIVTVSDKDRDDDVLMGLLVHETTHIKQKVMSLIRERDPSPEFEAYAMQAMFMSLLNAYSKTRYKKKD